jgi:hypothetical protein
MLHSDRLNSIGLAGLVPLLNSIQSHTKIAIAADSACRSAGQPSTSDVVALKRLFGSMIAQAIF